MGPITKISRLKAAVAAGDHVEALRIAARFPRLGEETATITRGWAAHMNPEFYRQIGHDPHRLVADGIAAVRAKYRV